MRPTKLLLIVPFIAGCATGYAPQDGYYPDAYSYGASGYGYAAGGYSHNPGSYGFVSAPFSLFSRTVVVPVPARPQQRTDVKPAHTEAARPHTDAPRNRVEGARAHTEAARPHADAPRTRVEGARAHTDAARTHAVGERPHAEAKPQGNAPRRSGGRDSNRSKR